MRELGTVRDRECWNQLKLRLGPCCRYPTPHLIAGPIFAACQCDLTQRDPVSLMSHYLFSDASEVGTGSLQYMRDYNCCLYLGLVPSTKYIGAGVCQIEIESYVVSQQSKHRECHRNMRLSGQM